VAYSCLSITRNPPSCKVGQAASPYAASASGASDLFSQTQSIDRDIVARRAQGATTAAMADTPARGGEMNVPQARTRKSYLLAVTPFHTHAIYG
jgi:hypothetical protein